VLNGFVCEVGCQRVVFTDVAEMCKQLAAYLNSPDAEETRWLENALNAKHISSPADVPLPQHTEAPSANRY